MENVTVILGKTFMLSDDSGNINLGTSQGFYHEDTRFLSEYSLEINGRKPIPLSSRPIGFFAASFYLSNQELDGIPNKSLGIIRDRYIGDGLHDDVFIENHGIKEAHVTLTLAFGADFADIFLAKKGQVLERMGELTEQVEFDQVLTYENEGFKRSVRIQFSKKPEWRGKTAVFELTIAPGERWQVCLDIHPTVGDKSVAPRFSCGQFGELPAEVHSTGSPWIQNAPLVKSDFDALSHAYQQSLLDLTALIFSVDGGGDFMAAGLPWFVAVFGRDSLITSLQTLLLGPDLARQVLETLAGYQGQEVNPFREEEPGKIVHEIRRGELALSEALPHSRYYGTIDATPLFLIVLSEFYRWTGELDFVEKLFPAAEAALNWIAKYGDMDTDGFIEYKGRSDKGLSNQGWKDSWDSVAFSDGKLAEGPIALVEVQGYVFDAKVRMAELYQTLGRTQEASELRRQADDLKKNFEDAFWMPKEGYLALALDGKKRQVDSITSNPGHCLHSGILGPEKAAAVAERLMADDMYSGWGVRTMAEGMMSFNPLSYHNGSIWPHDNGIIAAGLARYGMHDEANKIIVDVLAAAAYFSDHRLPELFAGFSRRKLGFPVIYPEANAPQAWAAGTPILFLQTMLGLTSDPVKRKISIDPHLPPGTSTLSIYGLKACGQPHNIKLDQDSVEVE